LDASLAATIPLNAMTASQALDHLPMRPRDTLLVTGAAGAVGGYAVELARTRGVRTIALGRPEDEELLLGLGATSFVPGSGDVAAAVRRFVPSGVDGVLDAAALGDAAMGAVRDGGTFVSVRYDVTPAAERGINVRHTTATPEAARLAYLSALAEVGLLTPRVALTYPLSQAAEAHARLIQGGRRGRIVLLP
jgi:NADPH:quinone reductase-like Zn-dependent oxidoreductase